MTIEQAETVYVVGSDAQIVSADVAADIGNARAVVLVRADGDDIPTAIMLPAVRSLHGAFSADVFASRGAQPGSWGKLARDEHIIERDGVERFLGKLAVERSRAASSGRGSDARYYDGTTLDFILAGVAAALPNATSVRVKLTTMLPISLWHLAPNVEAALRGSHSFAYNGREMKVQITSVAVKREGEIAFGSIAGDTSGNIMIIDGGGRTVNVALFKDGEYRTGATFDNMGVEVALDNADAVLLRRVGKRLQLSERAALLDAMVAGQPYSITFNGENVAMHTIARQQFDVVAAALVQELSTLGIVGAARRVVFVGGAAHGALFGDAIKAAIPQTETNTLKELANAYAAMNAQPAKKAKRR